MRRFKLIFLHIGPHKTGSTAIQAMCDQNRSVLARHGILYPFGRWHGQLGSFFSRDKINFVFNRHSNRKDLNSLTAADTQYILRLRQEFSKTNADTVVLSYEGFIDLQADSIGALKSFLDEFSQDIKIIAYCRHPISFARSQISQSILMGYPIASPEQRRLLIPKFQDYFEKYAKVFGVDKFLLTEFTKESLVGGDVRTDFLQKIGFPKEHLQEIELSVADANESLSAEAIMIGQRMAQGMPHPEQSNFEFLRRYGGLLKEIKGAPLHLSEKDADWVMEAAAPHLQYLRNRFDMVLSDFHRDDRDHPENNQLFSESAILSLSRLLRYLSDQEWERRKTEKSDMIEDAYRFLFGREATIDEKKQISNHRLSSEWRSLRNDLLASAEFRSHWKIGASNAVAQWSASKELDEEPYQLVTREQVVNAYRFLLGREPEGINVIDAALGIRNWRTLRRMLIESPEFQKQLRGWQASAAKPPIEETSEAKPG